MPIKYYFHILQTQNSLKYNGAIDRQFTVREMKFDLDPLNNYSLRVGTVLRLYDSRRKSWSAALWKHWGF